jgi:hypothetical protein
VLAWSLWLAIGSDGRLRKTLVGTSMRRAGLAVCASVSVVEAVREDRCQALALAPRYDSLQLAPGWVAFRSELSAVVPASAWPTSLA